MSTEKLQNEIKKLLAEMNWTLAAAARRVYYEIHDSDDPREIERFVETFKKRLSRSTTRAEHLEKILQVLCTQRDAQKLRTVKPVYIPSHALEPVTERKMREISRAFDRELDDETS